MRHENTQTHFAQETTRTSKGSTWKGVLGGALAGSAMSVALVATLMGAGVIGTTNTQQAAQIVDGSSYGIVTASENTTVAEIVAAKCLPSVASINIETPEGAGIGSGVVLDTEGHVITNWHVAGDATKITATIDGTTYDATLVGGDASSDIAVIKVELNGALVTPMEIGDSSQLVVGDWVMTLGSPLGLDQSASSGIVSALYRNSLMSDGSGNTLYTNLIQVDAAINGGNSGGALVNDQGQLVGINSLLADASGGGSFSGIGFAIPGNYAVDIANKVIAGEPVTHAYIGLSCATVNQQVAQSNHLQADKGAYIAELEAGAPGAQAGLQVGDIITRIGEHEVASADDFILGVRSYAVGDTVEIEFVREGQTMTTSVQLGSDEKLQERQAEEQRQQEEAQQQYLDEQQQYLEQYQKYLEQYQRQQNQGYSFPW